MSKAVDYFFLQSMVALKCNKPAYISFFARRSGPSMARAQGPTAASRPAGLMVPRYAKVYITWSCPDLIFSHMKA